MMTKPIVAFRNFANAPENRKQAKSTCLAVCMDYIVQDVSHIATLEVGAAVTMKNAVI